MDAIIAQPVKKTAAAIAAAALIVQPKIIGTVKSKTAGGAPSVRKAKTTTTTTTQKFRIGFGTKSIIVSGANSVKFGIHISETGRIERYSENILGVNDTKLVVLISGIIVARIKAGNTHEEIVAQMRNAGCESANSIRVFHNLIAKAPISSADIIATIEAPIVDSDIPTEHEIERNIAE
jgi:hypothetical protein